MTVIRNTSTYIDFKFFYSEPKFLIEILYTTGFADIRSRIIVSYVLKTMSDSLSASVDNYSHFQG